MNKIEIRILGAILILLGVVLGCNSLGITDINILFDGWWTLFIIIPCFIGLIKDDEKTGSIIGLLIGIGLLLACQDVIDFSMVWKLLLPLILVVIGLSFVFKDVFTRKVSEEIKKVNQEKNKDNEYCATFSAQNVEFDNETFKGSDLTAVFGGVKCDLTKAKIKEDSVINACSVFGGIEILVPKDVKVKVKSTSIFGGVSEKNKNTAPDKASIIYVNAVCIFGGVTIYYKD